MKKKVRLLLLVVSVIIFSLVSWYLIVPDVRHQPLTSREVMLLNPLSGETTALFEIRRGEYELNLYHYHFGERVVGELLNPITINNRTDLIAFYSSIEDETISFGMRTGMAHVTSFLTIDLESYGGKSWGPVDDMIFRIRDEQILMAYQFISDGGAFPVSLNATGFGERIDDLDGVDHVVFITIRSVN